MRAIKSGWGLFAVLAAVVTLAAALTVRDGTDADALGALIRMTARTSLVLFLLAFTARPAASLWPNGLTRWALRNRRFIGLAFAWSHGLHGIGILALWRLDPAAFTAQVPLITLIFGGLAYLLIAAMAATSFRPTAALIGPRAWRGLHLAGGYYIALVFLNSYAGRAAKDLAYLPLALAVVGALALRLAARLRRRRAGA
ncbi:hypothetical protein [Zavarzinia compransoris]|uniref:Ferric oxidoreductase domain-containing protein n=1 Tax=Zavarzinia compransoris TaxID=1264899 RepID=A0A317E974_9PROT|nr:hypothetical protein [Zavarzinia compransoris]PWR23677.1 hypothetical protein DKG75_03670 [Zavarzinia compransoris]TDP47896.1 hypothetical protein DES42_102192 [Zavarzinia compransoris]